MSSFLIRFSRTLRYSLPAILALVLQIQILGISHPPPWPDEALFSNPAAELAEGNGFRTMVLDGLVPGMEQATLWNSPLYMVSLAGVYSFTGESLEVGRAFSLIIAIAILLVLTGFLQSLQVDAPVLFIAPLLLALDPTFVRGANVIRMDGLCLLFCMLALQYSYQAFQQKKDHFSLLSGVFLGLGALSHPAALYGVSLVVVFHLFRWRGLFFAFCGVLLALSPWMAYIAANWDIFQLQFLPQLVRKTGLLTLWGGPTGGVFVVFSSQYGGGSISMLVLAALVTTLAGLWLFLWKELIQWNAPFKSTLTLIRENRFALLSLAWPMVTAFCMLSVEGWYAMHSFPYLILGAASFFALPFREQRLRRLAGWILRIFAVGILILSVMNVYKKVSQASDSVVQRALQRMIHVSEGCSSIYVRSVPDPYFHFRELKPEVTYYEFVPARLSFPAKSVDHLKKYASMDCFLLEGTDLQGGPADEYVKSNRAQFQRIPLIFSSPAMSADLYLRISKEK